MNELRCQGCGKLLVDAVTIHVPCFDSLLGYQRDIPAASAPGMHAVEFPDVCSVECRNTVLSDGRWKRNQKDETAVMRFWLPPGSDRLKRIELSKDKAPTEPYPTLPVNK